MTVNEYLNLVSAQFRDKNKFISTVELTVEIQARIQELLKTMTPIFDVDTAFGSQLDVIGEWVGVTRYVDVPIPGVYFRWDGTDSLVGWNFGVWRNPQQPSEITSLPDDAYRTLIRTKIAANQWDGTLQGMYSIWNSVFPQYQILIVDNQDMSYDLGIVGGTIDSLTRALFVGGYIPLKPEGVRINQYFFSIDAGKVFSWDLDSATLGGWDESSWVTVVEN